MSDAMTNWQTAFDAHIDTPNAQMSARVKREAFARFAAHGIPTRRHEYWKYTPVKGFTSDMTINSTNQAPCAGLDCYRLTFVDGMLDFSQSDIKAISDKIELVGPELDTDAGPWFNTVFAEAQPQHTIVPRPMADLNLALFTGGVGMRIASGQKLDKPIHMRYLGSHPKHLRFVILLEEGTDLTLIESGAGSITTGAEATLQKGATLNHVRFQTEVENQQYTNMFVDIAEEANLKTFTLSLGGEMMRNEIITRIHGDDATCNIAGGILGNNKNHIDNTVFITHDALNGESRQVFKNVVDDDARAVFQGKILVKEGAQKTDGYQMSQSVLLSEGADFNAKPELEIYADDVACSHGSTTGALDETALFYLRSRGVPLKTAQAMLIASFLEDAIAEITDETLRFNCGTPKGRPYLYLFGYWPYCFFVHSFYNDNTTSHARSSSRCIIA